MWHATEEARDFVYIVVFQFCVIDSITWPLLFDQHCDIVSWLSAGVDPAKKELHLSDADFQSAFGMSLSEFQGLAKWKQTAAKKKVGIF